jgi:putative ABC transport system ATP-binding protein
MASFAASIVIEGLRFAWAGGRPFRLALEELRVAAGERLLLVGPSGSGKSTLLGLLCGTLTPQAGRVSVLGHELTALPGPARDRFRARHFGIIFQLFNLLPYLSILDNVLLPLSFAATRRRRAEASAGSARAEAARLLAHLGLDGGAVGYDARAASLSVGQQQRVAAARALIGRPEIVVADEPTSALDRAHQLAFLDLLAQELAACGGTLVMVSHDESLATRFDRVLSLPEIARLEHPAPP